MLLKVTHLNKNTYFGKRKETSKNSAKNNKTPNIPEIANFIQQWSKNNKTHERTLTGCDIFLCNIKKENPEKYSRLNNYHFSPCNIGLMIDNEGKVEIAEKIFIENSTNDVVGEYTMYFDEYGTSFEDEIDIF